MTDIKHDPPKDEPEDDDQPTTAGRPRSQEERDAILERETVVDRKLRARRDSGAERPVSQSTAGRRGTSSRALKLPPVELPDDAPHTLGRYRLLRELGRGGMGIVYLGVDDEMQRLVALKVLPISMIGHGDMLERFRREENAVLHLEHPGIVPVFDVGQHEGVPFFVMRYVNGMRFDVHLRSLWHRAGLEPTAAQPSDQTVTHLAGKHPTGTSASLSVDGSAYFDETHPTGEVLHIVEQVARALHHAHDHGVIHRDVKPSNVMIDGDGNPQLMDFGLAKLASDATITQTGRLMGTVPYMSPEQVATQRIGIDHRTDIYSLGVMLFESLTGRRPFTAKNAEELMFDIIMKAPPSPLTVNPHLTKDMETVVLKCLEKNPEHRFQSAHELAEELARLRAHQQIESEPVGRLARAFRWAARHRALSGLILSLVLASLLLIGILVHGAWTDRRERERFANHQAESARTSIAALSSIEERLAAAVDQQHRLSMLPAQSSEDLAAMERLRTEIGAAESDRDQLQRSIDRYYSRAIAAGLDVRDERDGHRLRWWRDAKRRGDLVIADSLEAELRRGRLGDQLRWVGKLSLSTEPAGLPVRALRLVDQPDGRRTVDQGQALDLGTTPVSAKELEAGSWLLRIETPDGFILDYPVYLEVDAHWGDSSFANGRFADRDWTLRIADYQAVSADGLRPVPAGPYLASEPRVQRIREPVMTWRWEEGFGIAADEASFADWFAFLSAVRKDGKVGLARLRQWLPQCWFRSSGPDQGLAQTPRALIDSDTGPVVNPKTDPPADFDASAYPVAGLSVEVIDQFLRWQRKVQGESVALPTASQWEKAARGVDGREYPWGRGFDPSFTAGRRSSAEPLAFGGWPMRRASFTSDSSVYGVRDLAGNVSEILADGPGTDVRWIAGGKRSDAQALDHLAWPRLTMSRDGFDDLSGFRLVRNLAR